MKVTRHNFWQVTLDIAKQAVVQYFEPVTALWRFVFKRKH
jgi:hypothetical protein